MDNYGGPNVGIREVAFDGYTDHVDMIPYTLNNSGVHDMYYIPIGKEHQYQLNLSAHRTTVPIYLLNALYQHTLSTPPCHQALPTHPLTLSTHPMYYILLGQVVNAGPILRLRLDFYREGFNIPTVPLTGTGRPTHFDIDYIR